jgi:osmotically-inducible protein OsmY
MKTLLLLIIGILLGVVIVHTYDHRNNSGIAADRTSIASHAEAAANTAGSAVEDKLVQWHLTSDDIKADLSKTGKVVRANAQVAGEKIDDTRVAAVIKAKYLLDRDISAFDISVDVTDGKVVLSGRVASEAIIGRAVELALDTDGVSNVSSDLTLRPLN